MGESYMAGMGLFLHHKVEMKERGMMLAYADGIKEVLLLFKLAWALDTTEFIRERAWSDGNLGKFADYFNKMSVPQHFPCPCENVI